MIFKSILFILILAACVPAASQQERLPIALLEDDLPGADATTAPRVRQALKEAGWNVQPLTAGQMGQLETFHAGLYSMVILPESRSFPAEALPNLTRFLEKGGDLLVLGGPPFSNLCWRQDNGDWVGQAALKQARMETEAEKILIDFNEDTPLDNLFTFRDTNDESTPSSMTISGDAPPGEDGSLHLELRDFTEWDTFGLRLENYPGENHGLLCFQARGGKTTTEMLLEVREKDGSRWLTQVALSSKWERKVVPQGQFVYWKPGSKNERPRGYAGDHLNLPQAVSIRMGLATTHQSVASADYEFFLGDIGSAQDPYGDFMGETSLPVLETISPPYKVYPVTEIKGVRNAELFSGLEQLPERWLRKGCFSPFWRPQGGGIHKNYPGRFIPLVKTLDSYDAWNGTPAYLYLNLKGDFAGSIFGGLLLEDSRVYHQEEVLQLITGMVERMQQDVYLAEAGSGKFCYLHDTGRIRVGARVINPGHRDRNIRVRTTVRHGIHDKPVAAMEKEVTLTGRNEIMLTSVFDIPRFDSTLYQVESEVFEGDSLLDKISHEMSVWFPSPEPEFVTTKDGRFYLPEQKKDWIPYGVNYMPSSGVALDHQEIFELWLGPAAYDPQLVDIDLWRVANVLNMNMVNCFVYTSTADSGNLLDLLYRCRKHGLRVYLSLRPHARPLDFNRQSVEQIIEPNRLRENDSIFAYGIAWEPAFGLYDKRVEYDAAWERWILERYGSLENAEEDWGFSVPRDDYGNVTGPSDEQIQEDGPWRVMVAAYLRFADDFVGKKFNTATRAIREIDPNHLISYRATESGNPEVPQIFYSYDLRAVAKAVDFYGPEGYARTSPFWEKTRTGLFTAYYARSILNQPVFWAEFGQNVLPFGGYRPSDGLLEKQEEVFENFLRMIAESGSDGGSAWWYPGGYRTNEKSDYGLLNPDGTVRPVARALERYRKKILRGEFPNDQKEFAPDVWFTVDRAAHIGGFPGLYEEIKEDFWQAVQDNQVVGFLTPGSGTNTVTAPPVAVGNVPYNGNNPPKYLNAEINYIRLRAPEGTWLRVEPGETLFYPEGEPVMIKASLGNTGEATWIAPGAEELKGGTTGAVYLSTTAHSAARVDLPIRENCPFGRDVPVEETVLVDSLEKPLRLEFSVRAEDRAYFGEKVEVTLVPAAK